MSGTIRKGAASPTASIATRSTSTAGSGSRSVSTGSPLRQHSRSHSPPRGNSPGLAEEVRKTLRRWAPYAPLLFRPARRERAGQISDERLGPARMRSGSSARISPGTARS
ncbi:MAG: hypothetical protein MZV64_16710 [Ignavibacteriales bacterium]|nr:hypothetical protein [Ignavibacteriales bacterium]